MIDVSRILTKLVMASGNNEELLETTVKIAWTRVAGRGLRQHVVPFRVYRKTLIVAVGDAIWQKQLHQMSGEFVARINRLLGAETINSIEFRIDPVTIKPSRSDPEPSGKSRAPQAIPSEIIKAAGSINDSDLREHFVRAAANCITRRDTRTDDVPSL